jgi:hypothetical protein
VLIKAGLVAANPLAARDVIDRITGLIEEALAAEQLETAKRLLAHADSAARRVASGELIKQVSSLDKEVQDFKDQAEAAGRAADTLKASPKDLEANLTLGKFLCFWKADWEKGLPHLARGSDPELQELAGKDLANPAEAKAQAALADRWCKAAGAEKGPCKARVLRRAVRWYRQALPQLGEFPQAQAAKKLKEVEQQLSALSREPAGEVWHSEALPAEVTGVAISRDGRHVLSGGRDGSVRLWDREADKEPRKLQGSGGQVKGLALTPDGKRALSGGDDGRVRLWDLTNQKIIKDVGVPGAVECVALSADGQQAAAGSRMCFSLIPLEGEGAPHSTFNPNWNGARSVAFSRDGSLLAWADGNGVVRLWSWADKREVGRPLRYASPVLCVALSADGRWIVTGAKDNTVRVWDARTGAEQVCLKGHTGPVTSVALSADGRRILSGSEDKTVRLWDRVAKRQLQRFGRHRGKVTSVALSGDGHYAVSGSEDKTVRLWRLPK